MEKDIMLENIIAHAKKRIASFIDCDDVEVNVNGTMFEVKASVFPLFSFNVTTGKTTFGQAHKVGYTPGRLHDLRMELQAVL